MTTARPTLPPDCPALANAAHARAARGAPDVRVGEHDHRVVAAELQDAALELARARLGDRAAGAHAAGEADLRDRRVDERAADVGVAVDDAQQPLGDAGAGEDARDPLGRERGVRRGLEHDAVARRQRDRDVAERRRERLGRRARGRR